MDTFNKLTTGAKVMIVAGVLLFIVSWFSWFNVGDIGVDNMWGGLGILAGLLLIALLVWHGLRLANVNFEIGVSSSMISAGLAVLILLFILIRFIDKPGSGAVSDVVDRSFWAWVGLALAVVIVIGAWMNMQAAGESFGDMRKSFTDAVDSRRGTADRDIAPPPATTPPASTGTESSGDTTDDTRTTP
jgi:hypothetical protein